MYILWDYLRHGSLGEWQLHVWYKWHKPLTTACYWSQYSCPVSQSRAPKATYLEHIVIQSECARYTFICHLSSRFSVFNVQCLGFGVLLLLQFFWIYFIWRAELLRRERWKSSICRFVPQIAAVAGLGRSEAQSFF